MLTRDDYATALKDAFDKLDADKQAYFEPTLAEMEEYVAELGLEGDNAKYALAWIYLWCSQYQEGPTTAPSATRW